MISRCAIAIVLLVTAVPVLEAQADPERMLRDRDPEERVHGVAAIAERGHPKAEALLKKAADDKDWEVTLRAVEALGSHGTPKVSSLLVKLALTSPLGEIRRAAAKSLGKIDSEGGAASILKYLKGETLAFAAEALGLVGSAAAYDALDELAKSSDVLKRLAGVSGLAGLADPRAFEATAGFLRDPDPRVSAIAAESLARTGRADAARALVTRLASDSVPEHLDRRARRGVRTLVESLDTAEATKILQMAARALHNTKAAPGAASLARLLGDLAESERITVDRAELTKALLEDGLAHESPVVRAAAARALGRARANDALEKLAGLTRSDTSERVRFHAAGALAALDPAKSGPVLVERLRDETDPSVREEIAAVVGRAHLREAAAGLEAALGDATGRVVLAAAISLGRL